MICINISKRQNDLNNSLTKAAGLEGKISIPGERSFFDTGLPDSSCDVICSQDSFCHAGAARHKALEEAARLLKPGGRMVFTDFMQTEEADDKDVEAVRWRGVTIPYGKLDIPWEADTIRWETRAAIGVTLSQYDSDCQCASD